MNPPQQSALKKPILEHPRGFEPPTLCFENTRSVQLSYGCIFWRFRKDSNLRPHPSQGCALSI